MELVNENLFGKRIFEDIIKDLEMRSTWINRVYLQSKERL